MSQLCAYCGKPLNEAQSRPEFKSCPRCSTNDGNEHIYYPYSEAFGTTEKRVTRKNKDGIQSYCTRCRGNDEGPHNGAKRCSEL
ncbi:phage FluMu protein Com [Sporolactobacillus spathodeae]|uniref:Phage FluMu protein Com n=1 Tax=Sporolactobacillus spathodeae TaxID=1465502 RepID=A0ABS2Q7H0_9BACL|nr:phage FluMu protein Com [Sporolactobacillus spathodeae]